MKRHDFITLIGSTAAWPLAARAQQRSRLPIIGFLGTTTPSTWGLWIAAFVQPLRELGWANGHTVAIEVRWAEGRGERYAEIAAEFVRLKLDVLVTGGAAIPAAKQATSMIPIVFAVAQDPVGSGFGRELGATGRQYHRPVASADRYCRQAPRDFARSCPQSAPGGGDGQCRQSCDHVGDARGSSSGPHIALAPTLSPAFARARS